MLALCNGEEYRCNAMFALQEEQPLLMLDNSRELLEFEPLLFYPSHKSET
jgi:hypothetical protein